jgi:SAM-dependent methyltransferase
LADRRVWGIMGGTTVARPRREAEGFFERFIRGKGIDIGHGGDPLTPDCELWDTTQGDAMMMEGVEDGKFDWVYSSHCLEHIVDPVMALGNWWRIVKVGGYLIVAVPDFELYEHGVWPPVLNVDHKTRWSCEEKEGCVSLKKELEALPGGEMIYCRLVDTGYNYELTKDRDQSGSAEVIVEGVVRKNA